MTKLWIWSDPHFENGQILFAGPAPEHDVCIVPGDLNYLPWAIESLKSGEFGNGTTIYTPGNHDYYRQESMEGAERLAEENVKNSNVFLANPGEYVFGGVRFLGCTLWTDYMLFGDFMAAMGAAGNGMRDHRGLIKTHPAGTPTGSVVDFTPMDALRRHKGELVWLERKLAEQFDGPTICISHHLPSLKSVPERFDEDPLTPAFASSLDWLIEKYQPDLWIHGHTHDSCDYNIEKTRVLCNPLGYHNEPNPAFKWDLVVEIGDYEPAPTMKM
jgi:calcineurin-like phosphoesterase family protein